jgi:hypothetical protein
MTENMIYSTDAGISSFIEDVRLFNNAQLINESSLLQNSTQKEVDDLLLNDPTQRGIFIHKINIDEFWSSITPE